MVCSYGGIASFGCEPQQGGEADGTCTCGADPSGQQRTMCMPPSSVHPDWCTQLRTQDECDSRERIDFGDGDVRRCRWVDIEEVRFDAATRSCSRAEGLPRCITLTPPEGNFCSFDTCMFGEDPSEILGPLALPLDPNSYELLEAGGEQLCGVGIPVGAWLPADEPSLGPCALSCG